MNRRAFLASLLIAPKALQRLSKPKALGLHYAQFKYCYIDQPARYDEMIFHQRDYYGKWNYETT